MALSLKTPEAPARYRFTRDHVRAMVDAGMIDPDARLELLDGELIEMPREGFRHVLMKSLLAQHFTLSAARNWMVVPESPLVLTEQDVPKPDIYIVERDRFSDPVDPATVALVIEVSDSSLQHDLRRKSAKYAQYAISEYWVVDIGGRQTTVFTESRYGRYAFERTFSFDERVTPARLPESGLSISALEA